MSTTSIQTRIMTATVCCAAAIGLFFAPDSIANSMRVTVRDAVRPGQWLAVQAVQHTNAVLSRIGRAEENAAKFAALNSDLTKARFDRRRLQIENARLCDQLRQTNEQPTIPFRATKSLPLVVPELIESAVLGRERGSLGERGLLIDRGQLAGILDSLPVLAGEGPVIDQGEDARVEPDQPVYSGRIVVGKIAGVGRWASTVRLVTDRTYRGEAQLARSTPGGMVFGAEGVFAGQGERLCRLERVSRTEPVSVGDEVYTVATFGTRQHPMYYGKVVKAELNAGAAAWNIWVKPALEEIDLDTVQVLRQTLNRARMNAN